MNPHLDQVFADLARERAKKAGGALEKRMGALVDRLFPEQRAFLDDPAKRKAILCPSRAGKSFAVAVAMLRALTTIPRANVLYIAFVRGEAREIMWGMLKTLNEEFELGLKFGEAELTVTNGKGSWLRLAGCESWGDVDKFRGVPRHLVVLDETATWHAPILNDLVYKVIEPRLGDFKGTLILAGTPGEILAGLFYDATGPHAQEITVGDDGRPMAMSRPYALRNEDKWRGVSYRWSVHSWPKSANISREGRNAWAEALELKARNGWDSTHPIWLREHIGRWVADESKLVSRYDAQRDNWTPGPRTPENPFGLPLGHAWRFVLSMDMGFTDPFALQLGAYSDTEPHLWQVYEFEQTGLTVTGIADAIRRVYELVDKDDIEIQVADLQGLGGMVVETLATEHGIYLEELKQRDKRDHIEIANAGFVDGKIKILGDSRLAQEMLYLAWDVSGLKPRSNQPNHNFDAWLGVVRHSRHLEARAPVEKPRQGTFAFVNAREGEEEERIAAIERRRARGDDGLNDRTEF